MQVVFKTHLARLRLVIGSATYSHLSCSPNSQGALSPYLSSKQNVPRYETLILKSRFQELRPNFDNLKEQRETSILPC